MSLIDFTADDSKEELCGNWKLDYFKICFHFNSDQLFYLESSYKKRILINNFSLVVLLHEGSKIFLLNFDIFLLFPSLVDKVFFKWALNFLLKNQNILLKLLIYFTLVYPVLFQWAAFQITAFPCFNVDWMTNCFTGKFCKICLQGISCLEDGVKNSLKEEEKC